MKFITESPKIEEERHKKKLLKKKDKFKKSDKGYLISVLLEITF